MAAPHYRIVFDGQLREGVQLETAKLNLAQLFKTEVGAVASLFSGQPVALKQGLALADAERYLQALQEAGVQARIEPEHDISLSLDKVEPVPQTRPAIDADTLSPYAPPKAQVDTPSAYAELKVFSLSGRIGRLRYLAWSLLVLVITSPLSLLAGLMMSASDGAGSVAMLLVGVGIAAALIPMGVQRLHDIGWSGWCMLLNLVPVVGSFFPLVMCLMPGSKGVNAYGPPPPANSTTVKVITGLWLAALALLFVVVLFTGAGMFKSLKEHMEVTSSHSAQSISVSPQSSRQSL
ncbi:DUF805 domain-containing protein [Pseudomonas sp. LJDD11]|uniref:DUF805 domain-containing protein n=1 Tax=unclassified Pseudomonas TaxID=196821 RepID=UPI0004F870EB|nr:MULTISPECIES: DUF805 domain-containing protein [unclassified Pseudomonas]MCQ9425987.1 DUF805 domain-containing protein [Pseudomonas sp. LJDD11]BAP41914.1 putative uncharacterized protein [Pseudomonas sp. StFLB209]